MKRMFLYVGIATIVPVLASAQVRPAPPAPPVPPAPPARQAPPAPPAPRFWSLDQGALEEALRAAERSIDVGAIREQARAAIDQARLEMEVARQDAVDARWHLDPLLARMDHLDALRFSEQQGQQPFLTMSDQSSGNYTSGLTLMTERKYDQAVVRFDRVIARKEANADGALYHKAFCQAKLGQTNEALATLAELKKSYDKSAYLKDARALEADVRKLGPDQVDDEEIKILAIQSLQHQHPDQAIPLLEGVLGKSTNSLNMKYRALYVLAGLEAPRAHQVLLSYAKGSGNPDLQRKAISYLGSRGQKTTAAELIDIYNSTTDYDVRYAVIGAFRSAGAKTPLMALASSGTLAGQQVNVVDARDLALRSRAISGLADLASAQELWPLYLKEEHKDLRAQWVSVFASMGAVDQLMQIVKSEKDPGVQQRAIRALGNIKAEKTGTTLVDLYATGDKGTKQAVISALGNQNNAESLVTIARKETDPELKRAAVSKLFDMSKTSKVAMDYLMEFIK
jgi:HEAT repeat protein